MEEKYNKLFKCTYMSERDIIEKITMLSKNPNNTTQVERLKRDIKNIEETKIDILNNIVKINEKRDNISLTLDKILFDNIVMMNSIIKNFELLLSFGNIV